MSKKSGTFDAYRAKQREARIDKIRAALKILSNANYSNVTRLAKDTAKVVTEFERAENDRLPSSERSDNVKDVSHVTLLRNREYRNLLEVALVKSQGVSIVDEPSISDFEALKIRNANLESQNAILKERIRSIDIGRDSPHLESDGSIFEHKKNKDEDILFLIKLIDGMQQQLSEALKTVLPGEESSAYQVAGFYGPFGLIATFDEMMKLHRIRNEQDKRS